MGDNKPITFCVNSARMLFENTIRAFIKSDIETPLHILILEYFRIMTSWKQSDCCWNTTVALRWIGGIKSAEFLQIAYRIVPRVIHCIMLQSTQYNMKWMVNDECINRLLTEKRGNRVQHGNRHGNNGEAPALKFKISANWFVFVRTKCWWGPLRKCETWEH